MLFRLHLSAAATAADESAAPRKNSTDISACTAASPFKCRLQLDSSHAAIRCLASSNSVGSKLPPAEIPATSFPRKSTACGHATSNRSNGAVSSWMTSLGATTIREAAMLMSVESDGSVPELRAVRMTVCGVSGATMASILRLDGLCCRWSLSSPG